MNKKEDMERFKSTQEILLERERENIRRVRKLFVEGMCYVILVIILWTWLS